MGFKLCSVFSDSEGDANKYSMIQYMFDGPQVEIKVKPHGNSKDSTPFFPTSKKTKERYLPKEVVPKITKEQGGEVEARGSAFLPRNRQQMSKACLNLKRVMFFIV